MPFKLISSKQCGAALKVIFEISWSRDFNKIHETDVNIHDFAVITFKQKRSYTTTYYNNQLISIQTKKNDIAKDLTVTVTCSKGDKNIKLMCSDEWSDLQRFTIETSDTLKYPYAVDIQITVSKIRAFAFQERLHEDTSFTDFELSADDGTVPVHKNILAVHSDMFKTMLLGSWKETKEGRIEVEGVNRQTLQHLKDYMYLGTLPDHGLQPLLLMAMRYMIDVLKVECLFKISTMVTEDNLDDLLNFAIQNKCDELLHNLLQKTPDDVLIAAFNKKRQTRDLADTD